MPSAAIAPGSRRVPFPRARDVLAGAMAAMLLAGCGGGDDPAPAPTATQPASGEATAAPSDPAASASDTPTDAATDAATQDAGPQADRQTRLLARAGTLARDDYPRGWTVFSPAAAIDPRENRSSCSYQPDGPEAALLGGAIRQGPHMQLRGAPGYAHSQVYVFADDEAASAWIDYIDTRGWTRCVRRQLQEFQDEQDSGGQVRLHTRQTPSLGQGGFSSYASFAVADDQGEIQAFTDYQFYVLGRTVIRLGLDVGGLSEEQYADYTAGIDAALQEAYARVYELEPETPAS